MKPTLNITTIYNMYHKDILNFVAYKMHHIENAEEICNDVFLKANRYLSTFDSEKSNIRTWLRTIAISCISDFYRVDHSDIFTNVSDFTDDNGNETFVICDSISTANLVESAEFKALIEKAFSTLKPKYKRIADLFFISELSHAEIVEITELPLNTIKVMIGRCREMLQVELQLAKREYLPK